MDRRFDVPGIFTRDLGVLVDFAAEWFAGGLEAPMVKVWRYSAQRYQYLDSIDIGTCSKAGFSYRQHSQSGNTAEASCHGYGQRYRVLLRL